MIQCTSISILENTNHHIHLYNLQGTKACEGREVPTLRQRREREEAALRREAEARAEL